MDSQRRSKRVVHITPSMTGKTSDLMTERRRLKHRLAELERRLMIVKKLTSTEVQHLN
jgi:hypothetical protein